MATKKGNEPMIDKWLVIVGDTDTGTWTIISEATDKKQLDGQIEELKDDPSPTIVIYTGDFLQ